MNEVKVNDRMLSFEMFTELDKSTIITFNAMGCTGLGSLDVPAADYVDASGCTSLVSLELPAATFVDAMDCTGLVSLALPVATTVDVRGCTGLSPESLAYLKVKCGENLILDTPDDANHHWRA